MPFSWKLFFVITYCSYRNVASQSGNDPVVETKVGLIKGLKSNDGSYSMFTGIPYGLVNTSNPFGDSSEHTHFEDTFEAYHDSAICPQVYQRNNTVLGTLDCLHLNIYVPSSASPNNTLPVMVWIHGGGFAHGFGSRNMYGPQFLVKHDVILVTLGYRVGPYGFMCLDIPEVPGNQGLKDQLMGLRWVKNNIEAFGGDVNRITLIGHSAGGHSAELHVRSTKEKLYHNIIMLSGSAVASTVLINADKAAPIKIAEKLGLLTSNIHEALAFLAPISPVLVVTAGLELGIVFKPCVERQFDGVDNFLTSSWVDTPVPRIENIPILIGYNEHELYSTYSNRNEEYFEGLNLFFDKLNETFEFSVDDMDKMERVVRQFYIGDKDISKNVVWPIIKFDSDFTYIHPVHRSINKFLESGSGDIFYYMFSYSGGRNLFAVRNNITIDGVSHSDELGYLFDMTIMPDLIKPEDQLIIDRMTTMWTNFAKYSNPTPVTSALIPISWIPLTAETFNCLRIDTELSVENRPFHDRMAFWDLFYEMNKDSQRRFEPSAAIRIRSHIYNYITSIVLVVYYFYN